MAFNGVLISWLMPEKNSFLFSFDWRPASTEIFAFWFLTSNMTASISVIKRPKMTTTITVMSAGGIFSMSVPRFEEFITEPWAEMLRKSDAEDLIALFRAV